MSDPEEEEEPNDPSVVTGGDEVKRKWSYVGKGHGNYERILTYSYVGEGGGMFNKETTTSDYGCRPRLCCIILSVVLTIAGGSYIYLGPETFLAVGRWLFTEVLTPGLVPFDCASNTTDHSDANASKIWSTVQQSWCCSQEHIGCGSATTSTTATLRTTTLQTSQRPHHLLHDCYVGYADWKILWTKAKKDWCCSHYGRGCDVITVPEVATTITTTTTMPQSSTHSTTSTLAATTTTTVSTTSTTMVILVPTTTTNKGCETECEFQQRTETCGSRVRVGVKTQFLHKKNACTLAHSTVLLQCPACAACTLAAAGCAAPAAAAPGELSYDCNFGFSNWARAWSAAKKVWCCNHNGRGCGDAATSTEG